MLSRDPRHSDARVAWVIQTVHKLLGVDASLLSWYLNVQKRYAATLTFFEASGPNSMLWFVLDKEPAVNTKKMWRNLREGWAKTRRAKRVARQQKTNLEALPPDMLLKDPSLSVGAEETGSEKMEELYKARPSALTATSVLNLLSSSMRVPRPTHNDAFRAHEAPPLLKRVYMVLGQQGHTPDGEHPGLSLSGVCVYLLKPVGMELRTIEDLETHVSTGLLVVPNDDPDFLDSLMDLLGSLTTSIPQADEGGVGGFVDVVDRTSKSVAEASSNLRTLVTLKVPIIPSDPSEARAAMAVSIPQTMECIAEWCERVEQVLLLCSQVRLEGDDCGPSMEVEYWRSRMVKFRSVVEQLESRACMWTMECLQRASEWNVDAAQLVRRWDPLHKKLQQATREAEDNVKYLTALDRFINRPLYKQIHPLALIDALPGIISSICLIYRISKYYCTAERMTELMTKVTNRLIIGCKLFITGNEEMEMQDETNPQEGPPEGASILQLLGKKDTMENINAPLWKLDRNTLIHRLKLCIFLRNVHRELYHRVKDQIGVGPNFVVSESAVFGKLDAFILRVEKVLEIMKTVHELTAISNLPLEGMGKLTDAFRLIDTNLQSLPYDILDYRQSHFDSDFIVFRERVEELEGNLATFISKRVSAARRCQDMLLILHKLEFLLCRPSLRHCLLGKHVVALRLYHQELLALLENFEETKDHPPVVRNSPPVAGALRWARHLLHRVETPLVLLGHCMYVLYSHVSAASLSMETDGVAGAIEALKRSGYQTSTLTRTTSSSTAPKEEPPAKTESLQLRCGVVIQIQGVLATAEGKAVLKLYSSVVETLEQYERDIHRKWLGRVEKAVDCLSSRLLVRSTAKTEQERKDREKKRLELLHMEEEKKRREAEAREKRRKERELNPGLHSDSSDHEDEHESRYPTGPAFVRESDFCEVTAAYEWNVVSPSQLYVNLHPVVREEVTEARALHGMGLEVPKAHQLLLSQGPAFLHLATKLQSLITRYESLVEEIPDLCRALFLPRRRHISAVLCPGWKYLTWRTLGVQSYIDSVESQLDAMQVVVEKCKDIVSNQIIRNMVAIRETLFINLNKISKGQLMIPSQFCQRVLHAVSENAPAVDLRIRAIDSAVAEVIHTILAVYTDDERKQVAHHVHATQLRCEHAAFRAVLFAVVHTLRGIRRRLHSSLTTGAVVWVDRPVFQVNIHLRNGDVLMSPDLGRIEESLNTSISSVLRAAEKIRPSSCGGGEVVADRNYFNAVGQHPRVMKVAFLLTGSFQGLSKEIAAHMQRYDEFKSLWKASKGLALDHLKRANPSLDYFARVLSTYSDIRRKIDGLPDTTVLGPLCLDTHDLKASLRGECDLWKNLYGNFLRQRSKSSLDTKVSFLSSMIVKLREEVSIIGEDWGAIVRMLQVLHSIRMAEAELEHDLQPLEDAYVLLRKHDLSIPSEEVESVENLRYGWVKLRELAREKHESLLTLQQSARRELLTAVRNFKLDVEEFGRDYAENGPMVPGVKAKVAVGRLGHFRTQLQEKESRMRKIWEGERLFGLPLTQFLTIERISRQCRLLSQLYDLYTEVIEFVEELKEERWGSANIEELVDAAEKFQQACRRLPRALRNWRAYRELQDALSFLNQVTPLMLLMHNSGLRPRHWVVLREITGLPITSDVTSMQLGILYDDALLTHRADVEDACNAAVKESEVEDKLIQLETEWETRTFQLAAHREQRDVCLDPKSTADLLQALEDAGVVLTALLNNRYRAPFADRLFRWMEKISKTTELVERWMLVQNLWLYMESVFSAADISLQLPREAKRFAQIDRSWGKLMRMTREKRYVVAVCCSDDDPSETLLFLTEQLELCQRSLSGYLESKRRQFPRFYFVSDPALLEILGQGSDPDAVQTHVRSIFGSIQQLELEDSIHGTYITGLRSSEGECVPLMMPLLARGNVEVWLRNVDDEIKATMRTILSETIGQMKLSPFLDLVESLPGQASMVGMQVEWTRRVDDALSRSRAEKGALPGALSWSTGLLRDLVRMTPMDLTPVLRAKLESLITVQIHQKDVIENLIRKRIRAPIDFEWSRQMRFYAGSTDDEEAIRGFICDAQFEYSFEYQGCAERLVITPLTERVYITLAQAMNMYLGGAPMGPAGTGKTETVKDLGKALGKFVVVLNCSDQMDYIGLSKIFKGLAESGAWGCFDEFNRIELQVLSVVAQQIISVLSAKRHSLSTFRFPDGSNVSLNPECGIFITMNPGYAGRTELPENVKPLFRSVAMMTPDAQIIVRVRLAASGFQESAPLSQKFNTVYVLCRQQLAKQRHYDFGLRSILTVLRACGTAQREILAKFREALAANPPPTGPGQTMALGGSSAGATFPITPAGTNPAITLGSTLGQSGTQVDQSRQMNPTTPHGASFGSKGKKGKHAKSHARAAADDDTDAGMPSESETLYRILRDFNLSKLVEEDEAVFLNILNDVFPGLSPESDDNATSSLETAIQEELDDLGLVGDLRWRMKVRQLYETSVARHGIMVLGGPMSGKTWCCRVLVAALSRMGVPHRELRMNPKAITAAQMFGSLDMTVNDWTDGIFSALWRKCCRRRFAVEDGDEVGETTWLTLDGPVDPLWIENLNTVLDDNKTLTLANGDRIPMSPDMRVLFEVGSVNNASPATISRMGLVFLGDKTLTWENVVLGWLRRGRMDGLLSAQHASLLKELFLTYATSALSFVHESCKSVFALPDNHLIKSVCDYLEAVLMSAYAEAGGAGRFGHAKRIGLSRLKTQTFDGSYSAVMANSKHSKTASISDVFSHQGLTRAYVFALTWGVGGVLDSGGRAMFSEFLRANHAAQLFLPGVGDHVRPLSSADQLSIFDFYLGGVGTWIRWSERVQPQMQSSLLVTSGRGPRSVFVNVPTTEGTRLEALLDLLVSSQKPALVVGEPGSSKSTTVEGLLAKQDFATTVVKRLDLSHATTPAVFQHHVEGCVEKIMGTTYGAQGGRSLLFFIDDISMPEVSEWGDQPTSELIRQLIELGGFYSLSRPGEWQAIAEANFVGAMCEPTAGRPDLPLRLKGQFCVIGSPMPSLDTMVAIYSKILLNHFTTDAGFPADVCSMASDAAAVMVHVWKQVQSTLLPTPTRAHYVFTLRDLTRIAQGLLLASPDVIDDKTIFFELFCHETCRVLRDRLCSAEDCLMFKKLFSSGIEDSVPRLSVAWPSSLLGTQGSRQLFTNILRSKSETDEVAENPSNSSLMSSPRLLPSILGRGGSRRGKRLSTGVIPSLKLDESGRMRSASMGMTPMDLLEELDEDPDEEKLPDLCLLPPEKRVYDPCDDIEVVKTILQRLQNQYNENSKGLRLDLVFFEDAVKHVLRLARVLSLSRAHMLLVGVGGSGKKSLSRLAAHVVGHKLFQISVTRSYTMLALMEDLRAVYRMTGIEGSKVAFLLSDTELQHDSFVDRFNVLLTSADMPGLFQRDDLTMLLSELRATFLQNCPHLEDDADTLYRYFIERVRDNLHVILCLSPGTNEFRSRIRKFPGIMNNCTVNWLFPWPQEALESVAKRHLDEFQESFSEASLSDRVVEQMCITHIAVTEVAAEYRQQASRIVYVTPTSYLSFLRCFVDLHERKREDIVVMTDRLRVGLDKLRQTKEDVTVMKQQMIAKDEEIREKQITCDEYLKDIVHRTEVTESKKRQVIAEKERLVEEAKHIADIQKEAEEELATAQPSVEAAVEALKQIHPADISMIKKLAQPPHLVKRILDTVLILRHQPLHKIEYLRKVKTKARQVVNMMQPKGRGQKKDATPLEGDDDEFELIPSWEAAKKMMVDVDFLSQLRQYPRDTITDETCELLQPYLEQPDFNSQDATKVSGNIGGLCSWVRALVHYHHIVKAIEPKQRRVEQAIEDLNAARARLQEAEDEVVRLQGELDDMITTHDNEMETKMRLQEDRELTRRRLDNANQLLFGLEGEDESWRKQLDLLSADFRNVVGDSVLVSAFLSYAGAFDQSFRGQLMFRWKKHLNKLGLAHSADLKVSSFLADDNVVAEWYLQGLPRDELSTDNGCIVTTTLNTPLLIDPQGQGMHWIKQLEKGEAGDVIVIGMRSPDLRERIEHCMANGIPVVVDSVGESIDSILDPILKKTIYKIGTRFKIRFADTECDYDPRFRLYLTTGLPRPHFPPEVFAIVTVVDFTVTFEGLEQQLLGHVVLREKQELEVRRQSLIADIFKHRVEAKNLANDLLLRLSTTEGNLLDDTRLMEVLADTKSLAEDVERKLEVNNQMEKSLSSARDEYLPVARRGSILYFVLVRMGLVNQMYQTSLAQFLTLFDHAISIAEPSPIAAKRIRAISDTASKVVYRHVCRGLFGTHRLLYGLQIALSVDIHAGNISESVVEYLAEGTGMPTENPVANLFTNEQWNKLSRAATILPRFSTFIGHMSNPSSANYWKEWMEAEKPEEKVLPVGLCDLPNFDRVLLVRCLREDRFLLAAANYVVYTMGKDFGVLPPFKVEDVSENHAPPNPDKFLSSADTGVMSSGRAGDSHVPVITEAMLNVHFPPHVPIVLILSPGADPTPAVEAASRKKGKPLLSVAMGQGQEKLVRSMLQTALEEGRWILFQNGHLAMKLVAEIHKQLATMTSVDSCFRLWVTAEPREDFPVTVIQDVVKVAVEPPKGLRAGMERCLSTVSEDMFESPDCPLWRRMVYSLCFLHATVQERRKFGRIGWNTPYQFSDSDLHACLYFLQSHVYHFPSFLNASPPELKKLEDAEKPSRGGKQSSRKGAKSSDKPKSSSKKDAYLNWTPVRYMVCEVMYGGRITDDIDRSVMSAFGKRWLDDTSFAADFFFARDYPAPDMRLSYEELSGFATVYPSVDSAEVFGLHASAVNLNRREEAAEMLVELRRSYATGSGRVDALAKEQTVRSLIKDIVGVVPREFDMAKVKKSIRQLGGSTPLNSFLFEEIQRMQALLWRVRTTCSQIQKALDGEVVMDDAVTKNIDAIFQGRVPEDWYSISFEAVSISKWLHALLPRSSMLSTWLFHGAPISFWLGGFFSPRGFLTALRQELVRREGKPGKDGPEPASLDHVALRFSVLAFSKNELRSFSNEGVYIHGLAIQGAGWDRRFTLPTEETPADGTDEMPIIQITLTQTSTLAKLEKADNIYSCPIYHTGRRADTFICCMLLKTTVPPLKWVLRGTAMICAQDIR
eukprot:Rmarinus@m.23243